MKDTKVKEIGAKIILECEISRDGLKVEWLRGDAKIRRGDERCDIEVDGKVHRLVFEKIKVEDASEYTATYEALKTSCKLVIAG